VATVNGEETVDAKDVVVLTKDTFDSAVNEAEIMLVKFYAPWCGHCKHLAPEYAKAATELLKNDPPVKLAEVDATVETELAERFEITGYPTLKIFRKGVASDYNGPREAAGIVKFMRAQAGPAAKVIEDTPEALTAFESASPDVAVIGYVSEGSTEESNFLALANANRDDLRFALVHTKATPKLIVRRHWDGEEKEAAFSGNMGSLEEMKKWLPTAVVPLAGVFNADVAKRYADLGLPRFVVFSRVDEKNDRAGLRYLLNRMRKAAGEFKGKLAFVAMDKSSREFSEFNFAPEAKIGVAVLANTGKYRADSITELNVDALKAFARDYLADKVEKYLKSEPIPEKNDEPVRVLVGKNFQEEVLDSKKDTFFMAYAPWCGHCKALHPKWEELAKKLQKHNDKVVIANIDATANDLPPQYNIRGFPTIFFVKAGHGDKPLQYEGGREVADLEKYVRDHTSFVLKDEL